MCYLDEALHIAVPGGILLADMLPTLHGRRQSQLLQVQLLQLKYTTQSGYKFVGRYSASHHLSSLHSFGDTHEH